MDRLSNDETSIEELMESINSSAYGDHVAPTEKYSPRESRSSSDDFHHIGSFDMSESSLKMSSVLAEVDALLDSTPRSSVDGGFVVVNGTEPQKYEDIDCTNILNEVHDENQSKDETIADDCTTSNVISEVKESAFHPLMDSHKLTDLSVEVEMDRGHTSCNEILPNTSNSGELNYNTIPLQVEEDDPYPIYTKWCRACDANLMKKHETEVQMRAETLDVGKKQLNEFYSNRRRQKTSRGDRNRKQETEKYIDTTVSPNPWQKVFSLIDSPESNRQEKRENDSRRNMFALLMRLKNA